MGVRHSLFYVAANGLTDQMAALISEKVDLKNKHGMTALLLACAAGHKEAATILVLPTLTAGTLNVRSTALLNCVKGDEGYSALMWAEERALPSVVEMLGEVSAAVVRRPTLVLFRREGEKVQLDVTKCTVVFNGFCLLTMRSTQRCPWGAKGYFELKIIECGRGFPQFRFTSAAFMCVLGGSILPRQPLRTCWEPREMVGDDEHSWAVDGQNKCTKHNNEKGKYECTWKQGDVVGLACDLESMHMFVSVNGSFAAPNGVVYKFPQDAVCDGLFAAFSSGGGKVHYNLGQVAFEYTPPSDDYKGFVDFV